jgi:radical SAM protein with 4Fe4S-binding SPASM domain
VVADGTAASEHPEGRKPTNPNPYFQNGQFPGIPVPCRSPYKRARINYDGTVQMCERYVVGSIYRNSLMEIWNGPKVATLRSNIAKDHRICARCDYFRFCIRANNVDYSDDSVFLKQSHDPLGYDPATPMYQQPARAVFSMLPAPFRRTVRAIYLGSTGR